MLDVHHGPSAIRREATTGRVEPPACHRAQRDLGGGRRQPTWASRKSSQSVFAHAAPRFRLSPGRPAPLGEEHLRHAGGRDRSVTRAPVRHDDLPSSDCLASQVGKQQRKTELFVERGDTSVTGAAPGREWAASGVRDRSHSAQGPEWPDSSSPDDGLAVRDRPGCPSLSIRHQ